MKEYKINEEFSIDGEQFIIVDSTNFTPDRCKVCVFGRNEYDYHTYCLKILCGSFYREDLKNVHVQRIGEAEIINIKTPKF